MPARRKMGDKFHNPEGLYFVSFATMYWLDVFTRDEYKDIIVDSLKSSVVLETESQNYCWGDFKRFTSKPIELWSNKFIQQKIDYIHNNPV